MCQDVVEYLGLGHPQDIAKGSSADGSDGETDRVLVLNWVDAPRKILGHSSVKAYVCHVGVMWGPCGGHAGVMWVSGLWEEQRIF